MSLIAELKRRNVIRMAGLYLVGAWLLVQVAGTVLPMFGAPEWMPRTVVVLLALGFVPALVFAWIFEMTPDGIKRDADVPPEKSIASHTAQRMNRLIVATLVLAVIYFCVDKFVLAPRRDAVLVASTTQVAKAEATTQATQKARDNSIAVLPFVNMSDDANNQFFSDGISEELLNVLVRVDGLSVASRTSSFAYRDKSISSLAIAKDLGVGHILEGSVRKAGNKVRITAQLIDAVNDRHIWSETYDRELTDIFAIQDEIANAIVVALRGSLVASKATPTVSVQADTENMQAYEIYLKARELFIARKDVDESVRLFERVVALDPKFARGWEGLAGACAIAESWGFRDRDYTALAGTPPPPPPHFGSQAVDALGRPGDGRNHYASHQLASRDATSRQVGRCRFEECNGVSLARHQLEQPGLLRPRNRGPRPMHRTGCRLQELRPLEGRGPVEHGQGRAGAGFVRARRRRGLHPQSRGRIPAGAGAARRSACGRVVDGDFQHAAQVEHLVARRPGRTRATQLANQGAGQSKTDRGRHQFRSVGRHVPILSVARRLRPGRQVVGH